MELGRHSIYEPLVVVSKRDDGDFDATLRSGAKITLNQAEKQQYDAAVEFNRQVTELYHVCVAAGLKPNGG